MHFAPAKIQPESFEFSKENVTKIDAILARYPEGRHQSAVLPMLDLAQRQCKGWLPRAAVNTVADMLGLPSIKVYEVATFYSMFNLAPIGDNFIQVCRTTPCWLRGSDELTETCKRKLGIEKGQTSHDGKFTLVEVECLGACANAPMVQINDDYYEDLTPETMEAMIDTLQQGKKIKPGSQIGRKASAPEGELTSLTDIPQVKAGKLAAEKATSAKAANDTKADDSGVVDHSKDTE